MGRGHIAANRLALLDPVGDSVSESELLAATQLTHSRGDVRLWRANAGLAWGGEIINRTPTIITLHNYRRIKLLPDGFSDLVGISEGYFTALEGKIGRRQPTQEQIDFLTMIIRLGGRAGVFRSVDEAGQIIKGQSTWEPSRNGSPAARRSR